MGLSSARVRGLGRPSGLWSPPADPAGGSALRRLARPLALGLLVAAAGVGAAVIPAVADLEEALGLGTLFQLRGPQRPPPEVLVVAIDRASARDLGVPADPARWPRTLHAQLVDALAARDAALVVFDLVFDPPRPGEDEVLASALTRARRVVLGGYLLRETVRLPAAGGPESPQLTIERLVPPSPSLADAAVGIAPFPLPKVPNRVSQFWAFKPEAGDLPTLPVVALQAFALDAYATLRGEAVRLDPERGGRLPADRDALVAGGHADAAVRTIREVFQRDPAAAARLLASLDEGSPPGADTPARHRLRALVSLYGGPSTRYLNFYGPPGTIPVVSYREAMAAEASAARPAVDVAGKVVFVGLADPQAPHQKDGFYTVFSDPSGADLSGVEIAATAFANLLEGRSVEPLGPGRHLLLLALWGLALGGLARSLPLALGLAGVVLAAAGYGLLAAGRFSARADWLPLVVPILLQAPLAIAAGGVWSHLEAQRERRSFRRALGLYLPAHVADQVARELPAGGTAGQLVYGTCLSTDAHQYSTLAETMDPAELAALMNRYYAVIFEPVRRHGGLVQDVVGDSMLAIWATARPDAAVRERACRAALDVAAAATRFADAAGGVSLPTRIGLHSGRLHLGNVGAMDHYEYRAVGDIVNAATRLEGLNKHLGTAVLVADEVLEGQEAFLTRCVGQFQVVGKSRAITVHELVARRDDATPAQAALCTRFGQALAAYRQRAWKDALALFDELREAPHRDGPSRFYAGLCRQLLDRPLPDPWDATVRMEAK